MLRAASGTFSTSLAGSRPIRCNAFFDVFYRDRLGLGRRRRRRSQLGCLPGAWLQIHGYDLGGRRHHRAVGMNYNKDGFVFDVVGSRDRSSAVVSLPGHSQAISSNQTGFSRQRGNEFAAGLIVRLLALERFDPLRNQRIVGRPDIPALLPALTIGLVEIPRTPTINCHRHESTRRGKSSAQSSSNARC